MPEAISLHDAVTAVWTKVPTWVPEKVRGEVLALAGRLPTLWRWGALELRLARGDNRVDLMGCVYEVGRDREKVRDQLDTPDIAPAASLLSAWSADPCWAAIPLVWLEWDLPSVGPRSLLTFACMQASVPGAPTMASTSTHAGTLAVRVMLNSVPEAEGLVAAVTDCLSALPEPGRLLHLGSLAPRGVRGCRVVVELRPKEVLQWLERIHWRGDFQAVAHWLANLGPFWRRVMVHYDVGDQPQGNLGLESMLYASAIDSDDSLCTSLSESGLVDRSRLQMAMAWAGRTEIIGEPPQQRLDFSTYFKIQLREAGEHEAKAYLCFNSTPAGHGFGVEVP